MTAEKKSPENLDELLVAMGKSSNLSSLAREVGLSPGDLKRRLKMWRKNLEAVAKTDLHEVPGTAKKKKSVATEELPELIAATKLKKSPLPAKGEQGLEIWTDGASRGNPGPASVGVVIGQIKGPVLCGYSETIGKVTNNVAEYTAVLKALRIITDWGIAKAHFNLDSELVVRQLTGQYRVKSPDLMPLYRQIVALSRKLDVFIVRHVRREQNQEADKLANLALDGKPLQ
jgi:ribonuclease HI